MQSTSLVSMFFRRALASSRLLRPIAQIRKTHMDETTDKKRLLEKTEGFRLAEIGGSRPQLQLLSSSSDECDHVKYCRCRNRAIVTKDKDYTSSTKRKNRYSTSSLDHDFCARLSGHDVLILDLSDNLSVDGFWKSHTSTMVTAILVQQIVKNTTVEPFTIGRITLQAASLATVRACRAIS